MYEKEFPNLNQEGYLVTSPRTRMYNCIAWATGDMTRWWWPDAFYIYYWPLDLPRNSSLDVFVSMFAQQGYAVCEDPSCEEEYEKIAIYVQGNSVTHAARQLESGKWTSKLGEDHDIEHTLTGLNGPVYGEVGQIMKRPKNRQ